ncbi:MAG TPA: O-antigen ligase family protein [bacterium]|nr:O-antigen ligase family protein [bacterium]
MTKIKTYLIYLFIFLLPWQTRWIIFDAKVKGEVFEYGRRCLYGFDVAFLMLFLLSIFIFFKRKMSKEKFLMSNQTRNPDKNIVVSSLPTGDEMYLGSNQEIGANRHGMLKLGWQNFFLFVGVVFIFLNIFLAESRMLAVYWWLRIGEAMVIFYLIKKMSENKKIKVAWSFVISLAIAAGLGIYQFFTQHIFASKWLGMASQNAEELGASVLEVNGERILRAYGSFSHPNVLAGFIVVAMVMLIILKFSIFNFQLSNIKKEVFYILSVLFIVALFFTFSRAGWLALALLIIEYNILYIYNKKFSIFLPLRQAGKLQITFFCVFAVLSIMYWPLVQTRLGLNKEPARLEVLSTQERISGYVEAYQIIKQHPWGVGLGNYTLAMQKISPDREVYDYQPVHNVFLLIAAELGLGWILVLALSLYCIYKKFSIFSFQFSVFKQKKYFLLPLYFCALAMLCLDHFWWTSASGMGALVFLGGLGVWGLNIVREQENKEKNVLCIKYNVLW